MKPLIRSALSIPILGPFARRVASRLGLIGSRKFNGSADYWENRYQAGGSSGRGSYVELAEFKANILNEFVEKNNIHTVIEFGCGDGNQLKLAKYRSYVGYDVSNTAIQQCRKLFENDPNKSFEQVDHYAGERADMAMSLDVIYPLVEDQVFELYMQRLFQAAKKYIVIYSSNTDAGVVAGAPHVRHRRFQSWIDKNAPHAKLIQHVPNQFPLNPATGEGSFADFYFYELSE